MSDTQDRTVSEFDRQRGQLLGLNDVTHARATTITTGDIVSTHQHTVETFRHRELGDFVFIQIAGPDGLTRIWLPPRVSTAIARQRDALGTRQRSKAAKAAFETRVAEGYKPFGRDYSPKSKVRKVRKARRRASGAVRA